MWDVINHPCPNSNGGLTNIGKENLGKTLNGQAVLTGTRRDTNVWQIHILTRWFSLVIDNLYFLT